MLKKKYLKLKKIKNDTKIISIKNIKEKQNDCKKILNRINPDIVVNAAEKGEEISLHTTCNKPEPFTEEQIKLLLR